jgi:hypothetical protein
MAKDILAFIGFVVASKKGYELFRSYRALKQENEFLRQTKQRQETGAPAPSPQGS